MEVFVAVVVVFAVTVGLLQPWGGGDLEAGSEIYCLTSDFNNNLKIYRTYKSAGDQRVPVESGGATFYRETVPVLTNVELDHFKLVEGDAQVAFTDFGRKILARVTREHRGSYLTLLRDDDLVTVWPVKEVIQLEEDELFPLPIENDREFAEQICPI